MKASEYKNIYLNEKTHGWYLGMKSISIDLLERFLPKKNHLKILDAGCGTGGMMEVLKTYGEVHGLDNSKLAISFCQKRGLSLAKQGDIRQISFPKETFQLITCFDVLYIADIHPEIVFNNFHRVLKKNGLLLIRVPAFEFLQGGHDEVVHTGHRFTKNEILTLGKNAGFKIKFCSYGNMFLFPLILIKRWWSKRLPGRAVSDIQPMPTIFNLLMESLLKLEVFLMKFFTLPFGVSLFVIFSKE